MTNERRRYVRVNDIVSLRYRLMDENEVIEERNLSTPHFGSQLLQLDNQFQVVYQRVKDLDVNVGEALDLLNQKIMVISERLSDEPLEDVAIAHEVSLSACGVSFPSEEKAGVDDNVWIELILRPIHLRIVTTGRVVGCERSDESSQYPYALRVDFTGVSVEDEESLIQHVIRRESQLLKEQRQLREAAEGKGDA